MKIGEWHRKYVQRLIDQYAFTEADAEEVYKAGSDDHDYEESDPEDAADEEMSYWGD